MNDLPRQDRRVFRIGAGLLGIMALGMMGCGDDSASKDQGTVDGGTADRGAAHEQGIQHEGGWPDTGRSDLGPVRRDRGTVAIDGQQTPDAGMDAGRSDISVVVSDAGRRDAATQSDLSGRSDIAGADATSRSDLGVRLDAAPRRDQATGIDLAGPDFTMQADVSADAPSTDRGFVLVPDGYAEAGGRVCIEALQCVITNDCTLEFGGACVQGCLQQTSPSEAVKFQQVINCLVTANRSCTVCQAAPNSPACNSCVAPKCADEIRACDPPQSDAGMADFSTVDTGIPEAGAPDATVAEPFGALCDRNGARECGSGGVCMFEDDTEPVGYCSKPCAQEGTLCSNAPSGTLPICTPLGQQGFCLFYCQLPLGNTYPCPTGTSCSVTVDTGLKICAAQ